MRILWIGPLPPHPGGSAISLSEIVSEVTKAGHQIRAIAPITKVTKGSGERFAAAHPALEIKRYLIPEYDVAPYSQNRNELVQAEGAALQTLFPAAERGFRPELVVVGRESVSEYIASLAPPHGLPFVQLVRGSPTGEILRGNYPPSESVRVLRAFGEADQIITVAKFQERGLRKLGLTRVTTIPNAIDTRRFRPRPSNGKLFKELRIHKEQIVVLVPANLHPRKRPFDVVESASRALAQNPRLVYVMIGSGHLRRPVQDKCRELNILDSFRFPGWIDYARMTEMMNLADVVVMASESEGMARAYLEAMACELVLLASDNPSAKELIRDGHNGLLFRVGDTEHLAALTLEMASDPRRRRRLGKAGRRSLSGRSLVEAGRQYVRILSSVARTGTSVNRPAARHGSPPSVPAYRIEVLLESTASARTAVLVRPGLIPSQLAPMSVLLNTPPPSVPAYRVEVLVGSTARDRIDPPSGPFDVHGPLASTSVTSANPITAHATIILLTHEIDSNKRISISQVPFSTLLVKSLSIWLSLMAEAILLQVRRFGGKRPAASVFYAPDGTRSKWCERGDSNPLDDTSNQPRRVQATWKHPLLRPGVGEREVRAVEDGTIHLQCKASLYNITYEV